MPRQLRAYESSAGLVKVLFLLLDFWRGSFRAGELLGTGLFGRELLGWGAFGRGAFGPGASGTGGLFGCNPNSDFFDNVGLQMGSEKFWPWF